MPTILLVDDQPVNLSLLENVLSEESYSVKTATSGLECLEIVEKSPPDLILLDVMMPHMDGLETCTKLREKPEARMIPIIFVTAKIEKKDKLEGLSAGAVDYITKPIDAEELLARVASHLDFAAMHKENAALKERLEKARRAATIGAVTEGIAHNLNNILAGAVGYLDVIKVYAEKPEKVLECADIVHNSLKRMIAIITQLRQITDQESIDLSATSLHEMLLDFVDDFKTRHEDIAQNISLTNELPIDTHLHSNLDIFNDVMGRLVVNAWESYSKDVDIKERIIEIHVELGDVDGLPAVQIHVQDRGRGLDPEIEGSYFEPFVSGHAQIGRGLGLAIARQSVESLKGQLTLNSREGGGACATWLHIK